MVHNQRVFVKSINKITFETHLKCGAVFQNVSQKKIDLLEKLHKKMCKMCRDGGDTLRLGVTEIIDHIN